MQEYIIKKKEFAEAEHTILKITKEWGVSIIRMDNYDSPSYNIALIEFTDLGDQYDLVDGVNFVTKQETEAVKFIEGLIETRKRTESPLEKIGERFTWKE